MIIIGTFLLTQNQIGKNLYIYPNGDLSTCTELTAVGDNPNYACVDEDRLIPDEDTTYVGWDTVALVLDLYEMQNHTSETGSINYIQVYARAKSHETAQHIDGVFKIICSPDANCSNIYKSDDVDLTTSYATYNKVWVNNPDDSLPWEWADIDTLCVGVECSSPPLSAYRNYLTLRPNAVGSLNQLSTNGCANNYECVDEVVVDEDTTYVYNDIYATEKKDSYNMENHTTENGTIHNVKLFWRCKHTGASGNMTIGGRIKTHGAYYTSYHVISPGGYTTESKEWILNPFTSAAWTWAEIDALEIGCTVVNAINGEEGRVTQIYLVVDSTEGTNPEIRTTQCYAKVNYNDEVSCTLNKPQQISTNHARNIKMLNFWDGSREVYNLNRSGKSLVLTGAEVYSDSCSHIICMRNMARNGNIVVISGLSLGYFNGTYRIRTFGWKKISEKPEHYKWILDLEDTEL